MTERTTLRIGTVEREQAAERLAEHLRAGRLELDEYDERVQQVYAARTQADLIAPFTDLPVEQPPGPRDRRRRGAAPAHRLLVLVAVLVAALAVLSIAGTAHGHPPIFWIPLVLLVVWVTRRRHRYHARW